MRTIQEGHIVRVVSAPSFRAAQRIGFGGIEMVSAKAPSRQDSPSLTVQLTGRDCRYSPFYNAQSPDTNLSFSLKLEDGTLSARPAESMRWQPMTREQIRPFMNAIGRQSQTREVDALRYADRNQLRNSPLLSRTFPFVSLGGSLEAAVGFAWAYWLIKKFMKG